MQQRLQIQQCFTADGGHRRQAHSAAGRRIEHPLRNLQESSFAVLFDAAVEQCAPISGEGLVDRHNPVVPRMPRVMDFSRFSTMGVALSTCTTRTGHIWGWRRTRQRVAPSRFGHRERNQFNLGRGLAVYIIATPKRRRSRYCHRSEPEEPACLFPILGQWRKPLSHESRPSLTIDETCRAETSFGNGAREVLMSHRRPGCGRAWRPCQRTFSG